MGFVWVGQGLLGSKCTQDGVTVLLELCMRFEQLDSVDSSRDRIALRDLLECPRIIILVLVLIFCFFMFIIFILVLVLTIVNIVSIFISSVKRAQLPSNCSCCHCRDSRAPPQTQAIAALMEWSSPSCSTLHPHLADCWGLQ